MKLRRLVAALAVVVALPLLHPGMASATDYFVGYTGFALWPGPYCGFGDGEISNTNNSFYISSVTDSLKDSPNCPNHSPANAGVFAAQPALYKRVNGLLAFCQTGVHVTNAQGTWEVVAGGVVTGCGSGNYQVDAQWRITYGGTPQYGDAYNGTDVFYS